MHRIIDTKCSKPVKFLVKPSFVNTLTLISISNIIDEFPSLFKVRSTLQKKIVSQQASEHAKKLRKMKKFGKKVQQEVLLAKQEKKRDMMKQLKAFRAVSILHMYFYTVLLSTTLH